MIVQKQFAFCGIFGEKKSRPTKPFLSNIPITVKFVNFRTPENCCNLPKIQTKRPNLRVFFQKDANGKQTLKTLITLLLKEQTDLGLHYLPRPICPKT